MDKETIEPILLKHIIEAQRKFLKPDLTDEQRKINAKWYLISSPPSYRGLIAGINELLESYSSELRKANDEMGKILMSRDGEIEQLKEDNAKLQSLSLQTIEDKDKEISNLNKAILNHSKEIERLKGLVNKNLYNIFRGDDMIIRESFEEFIKRFTYENNL